MVCLALAAFMGLRAQEMYGQGAGQEPAAQTQDPRARIHTTVSLVVVPVTVKDSAGELVTDLQQNDFRVFEDGVEQPIAQFSAEAFPLSAAILIDDDLKTGTAQKVQKTLETLAGAFSASDEVSLWRFDQVPEQISENFIADNDTLLTQLKHIDLSSSFPGIGSYTMTNGPRVNTAQPPGPAKVPTEANGHPNTKHIDDAIYAAAEQLQDRPRETAQDYFSDLRRAECQEQHAQVRRNTAAAAVQRYFRLRRRRRRSEHESRHHVSREQYSVQVRAFDRRRYFLRRNEPGKPRRIVRARFRTGAQSVHDRLFRRAYRPLQAVSRD